MLAAFLSHSICLTYPWHLIAHADNFNPISTTAIAIPGQTLVFTETLHEDYTRTILYLPGLSPVPTDTTEYPVPQSVRRLADIRQAVIVILEHRCIRYNSSESLALCTVDQALADIANLFLILARGRTPPREVLIIGEGYGGSLAAFFKAKYPQYANYTWAISAPVTFNAFSADADAQLLIALGNQTELCPRYTQIALAQMDASNPPERVYEAAEALVQMLESGTLAPYCRALTSQTQALAVLETFVESTIKAHPRLSIFDATIGERFVRCSAIGHFNVHNPRHRLRPATVNASLFRPICAGVGVDLEIAEDSANRRFGGLAVGASATLFTYTRWDVHEALMAVPPDPASERDVRPDLNVRVYDRNSVDEDAVERIMRWMDRRCEPQRGVRVHGRCKCKNGWAGASCVDQMITKSKFSGLAALAVALPTLIVLMTSAVAARTVLGDVTGGRSKPFIL
jgi:hypothetical protein